MREQSEVVVVGAGIVGLSVAYHLAEQGIDVTVVERSGIAAEQSGVQPGGVRQQWSTKTNCEMAKESVEFYRNLRERLETKLDVTLAHCGYLFIAESSESLTAFQRDVALQNALGIPSRIVVGEELEDLVTGLDAKPVRGAAWCADDGYFNKPQSVVEAFAQAAQRCGARLCIADVTAIEATRSGWQVGTKDGEKIDAAQLVIAAGYDSPALLTPLGIELPIVREARYLFLSEPIHERILEPLVVAPDRRLAAKQLANGRILASDLGARGEPDTHAQQWRRNIHDAAQILLPILEFVTLPLLVEGYYDVTPDHNGIIEEVAEGLWVAAGFSGHGFMMAPAAGRIVATAVSGAGRHRWLDELALTRFSDAVTAESRIV